MKKQYVGKKLLAATPSRIVFKGRAVARPWRERRLPRAPVYRGAEKLRKNINCLIIMMFKSLAHCVCNKLCRS
jgi:hypothetical protein